MISEALAEAAVGGVGFGRAEIESSFSWRGAWSSGKGRQLMIKRL